MENEKLYEYLNRRESYLCGKQRELLSHGYSTSVYDSAIKEIRKIKVFIKGEEMKSEKNNM